MYHALERVTKRGTSVSAPCAGRCMQRVAVQKVMCTLHKQKQYLAMGNLQLSFILVLKLDEISKCIR